MDAANIMKPALARGVIQCIGATTLDEYRQSIEKDGALERRFQKVLVEATSAEETLSILKNVKDRYEEHHHVTYTDEALKACVNLTERYITDRYFPDKAIDALDEVGSHIHLLHAEVPTEISDKQKELEETINKKNIAVKNQNFELAAGYRDNQSKLEAEIIELNDKWSKGQNGNRHVVTDTDVADVVSTMAGIPVQRIAEKENIRLKNMSNVLSQKVIAQDSAIKKMVKAIQRNRVGIKDPNHPIGVFMFLGPTGVGKDIFGKTVG
jgi:ATP-dependent Clp protease ATP-binding subunit ClpC